MPKTLQFCTFFLKDQFFGVPVQQVQEVQEVSAAIAQPRTELVVFFCSNSYDLKEMEAEINRLYASTHVIGCTTAGEIGPAGCCQNSLVAASLSAGICAVTTGHIDHLQQFTISDGNDLARRLMSELEGKRSDISPNNSFAISLIDGLSVREEPVSSAFQNGLRDIPLIGGSSGDGLNFCKTYVFGGDAFRSDRAALTVVNTTLPFRIFKTQHFVPSDERLVITEADSAHRIVREINGLPAAQEYGRVLGVDPAELDPQRFADSPVVVLIDGSNYVRSIQKLNDDGSITFFCAIEEGLVLRLARGVDLIDNLEEALAGVRKEIGRPQLVLGFDCILRRLEIIAKGLDSRVATIFRENKTIGFNTYGEQYRGIHVNQTLTGVAIGTPAETHDA